MQNSDVQKESSPSVSEDVTPQEQEPGKQEVSQTTPATPGSQTRPEDLLAALREERAERAKDRERLAELEAKLEQTQTSDLSEDDGVLKRQLDELKNKVSTLESDRQKSEAIGKYPEMKDAWSDFESFRADPENKGMNFNTALKAFRIEKGLVGEPRQGLEKPTGGPRTPQPSGMPAEEVKSLRENNSRKYRDMLRKGLIKLA